MSGVATTAAIAGTVGRSIAAAAATAGLVLAVAWPRRPGTVHRRHELAPGAASRTSRPAPDWVANAVFLLGLSADPGLVWTAARLSAVAAVAGAALTSPPFGVVAGLAAPWALRALRRSVDRRWWDRRDAHLAGALDHLATELRAGSALAPAIVALGPDTPDPLGAELRSIGEAVRHGAPLTAALDQWAARPTSSQEVRLTATALHLAAQAGGEVARSIDRVAATLRERREIQAESAALATQARASAAVLAVAPVAFAVLVAAVEPGAIRFLTASPAGAVCLGAGVGLEVAGVAWMARILRSVS